jgi:hypothetical protein
VSIQVTPIPRLTTLTTPAFTLGTANAAGDAITAVASNSTILTYDTTDPAAVAASAAVGTATTAARRDHVHQAVALITSVDNAIARFSGTAGQLQGYTSNTPTISDTGVMLKPGQPAFLAVLETTDSNVTGGGTTYTLGGGNALVDIFDQGGDFATQTFTAPVTGRYLLSFSMRLAQGTTSMTLQEATVVTSNRSFKFRNDLALGGVPNSQMFGTVVADMDVSDTATVTLRMNGGSDVVDVESNAAATFFAGLLLA